MLFVDIALRGATIGLLGLLAALMWRAPIGWEGRLSITMVAIAKSAFLLTHIPISLNMPPLVEANLLLLASLVPNAVTWLIVTIFLDPPGRRWPWLVACGVQRRLRPVLPHPHLSTAAGWYDLRCGRDGALHRTVWPCAVVITG